MTNGLGERIRELREKRGFTVRELAEQIDKSAGYVSRIEARGEIPRAELLLAMAVVLKAAPEELFELAKESQLERLEREIEEKQRGALALFRKERK